MTFVLFANAMLAPAFAASARSEPFPYAAEIGREIEFLTVNGDFERYQDLVPT